MATAQDDYQLASLLESLTDAAAQGDLAARERALESHPEFAEEIQDLWGAIMVANAAAYSSTQIFDPEAAANEAQSLVPAQELELPYTLGDYQLLEELGRGGMGVVYRARQSSLNRTVAIKLILRGTLASEQDQLRFRSEAEAAARLQHPSIVPIYEVGEHNGQLYFSMQLIEGVTLGNRLRKGPLPDREAATIVQEVARAIHFAHQKGIVHRDLKPANILLDRRGKPHISDFGLAKRLHDDGASAASLTQAGAVLGTPSYMAPEQASGDRGAIGAATDIYSLGAILYALLTARPPFQGTTPVDTVLMLLEQEPVAPRLLNPKADRDLEMIVMRCLQKPAELRYNTAEDLSGDLRAYLAGDPVAARSGQFSQVIARIFRETHHATLLENWGLLWMWHALVLLVICLVTNGLFAARHAWPQMATPTPYLVLWGGGLLIWAPIFWRLRHRAGPVTAVERQIAHIWGGSVVAVILLFVAEWLLELPVLTLSPILALIGGMVFTAKAGVLSGAFYVQAAALFLSSLGMAWMQRIGLEFSVSLFGLVAAAAFFFPGLKYYRQSRQTSS